MFFKFKYIDIPIKMKPIPPSPGESSNSPETTHTPPKAANKLEPIAFTIFILLTFSTDRKNRTYS